MMIRKRFVIIFACFVLFCTFLPIPGFCAEFESAEQGVALTVFYEDESKPIVGAEFSLYELGCFNEQGELVLSESFRDLKVAIQHENTSLWRDLGTTLEGLVLRDQIPADGYGKTDAFGRLTFSSEDHTIGYGLYLLLGTRHVQGNYVYEVVPTILHIGQQRMRSRSLESNFSIKPKFLRSSFRPNVSDTAQRKVLKIWDDEGFEAARPEGIVVQLLRDNEIYDCVVLNKQNNWQHVWHDLDSGFSWKVTEKELDNYLVSVSREGDTFAVTNTYIGGELDDSEDLSDEPIQPPDNTILTQSGQIWWPVPLMVVIGLYLICAGFAAGRRSSYES